MSEKKKDKKYKYLFLSLLFDGIGMLSYAFPGLGEFVDVIWASVAAWLMTRMYPGTQGKIGGGVAFLEELLPGMDIVPTFTLMWFYTYVFAGKKVQERIEEKADMF